MCASRGAQSRCFGLEFWPCFEGFEGGLKIEVLAGLYVCLGENSTLCCSSFLNLPTKGIP